MRVYVVRHGETGWNREEVFRGRADIPLDDTGLAQAEATGRALASVGLTAVYSSPLSRALQTAEAIASFHGLDVIPHEGFSDIDVGEWEGVQIEAVKRNYPDFLSAWQRDPASFTFPGGESLCAVMERAVASLEEVASRREHDAAGRDRDAAIAVVSHRVVNKLLLLWALGAGPEGFWRIRQDTCCINLVEMTPMGPVVHTVNDRHHLEGIGASKEEKAARRNVFRCAQPPPEKPPADF
ncbi:MAG: histidine phosphatase family protein [Firmicutes bacterium]|jgi:broad specificity phosphatase PhoE|nr:histidine phosphatase family protein [Bacillota bacterium]